MKSGSRVLVTGGAGLIGSWLVKRLLLDGSDVSVLVLDLDPRSEFVRSGDVSACRLYFGDLKDYDSLERVVGDVDPEFIFHLGAQTLVQPALKAPLHTFQSNIAGTWNVLEAVRRSASSVEGILIASSDKAYGDADTLPYTEDTPLLARTPYDVSKSCTDMLAQTYAYSYGLPTVIARCGNVYGGGDLNWSRIIPGTLRALVKGETPVLRSDGTSTRDYVHVDDVVNAYILMAKNASSSSVTGQAFNFSREEPLSAMEIYREVCSAAGIQVDPIVRADAHHEITHQHLSSEKARKILGWKSVVTLNEGLSRTVPWYLDFLGER